MTFKNIVKYFKRKISRKILRKPRPTQDCTRIPKTKESKGFQGANGKNYIFLPAYVEIELREFSSLSVMDQIVKFRGKLTIKLLLYPPEAKHHLQNQLKILLFKNKPIVKLNKAGAKSKIEGDGTLRWTFEIDQEAPWTPNLRWLPFDTQNLPICVELAHFKLGKNRYYFNILNEDDASKKVDFLPKEVHVERLEDFMFSSQPRYKWVQAIIGKTRIEYSPQITLYFHLFRSPLSYFLIVLIPNFILQVISIMIFFQDDGFGTRVVTITGLILATVAFLPSVRDGLPHIPYVTLMDFIIYAGVVNLGFCLLETNLKRHNPDYESKVWLIGVSAIVFSTLLVSVPCLIWRFFEWLTMKIKNDYQKELTESKIEERTEKYSKKLPKRKDRQRQASLPIYDSAKNDEAEINSDKDLNVQEKRYVQREIKLRRREEEGVPFQKF